MSSLQSHEHPSLFRQSFCERSSVSLHIPLFTDCHLFPVSDSTEKSLEMEKDEFPEQPVKEIIVL